MQSLFITIATMLWAVNIEKHTDAEGNSITPPRDAFTDTGMVMSVLSFCIVLTKLSLTWSYL